MQAFNDLRDTCPAMFSRDELSKGAASAYVKCHDGTNIAGPILTSHANRDHDDCQVISCTDDAPCSSCIGDSCSSTSNYYHDSSGDGDGCDPDTNDSFISTSEPLTPTVAARLDEAILSLGPRSSVNMVTDTAATDLATITSDHPRCATNVLFAELCRRRHREHLRAFWHLAAQLSECAQRVNTPLAWRAAWALRAPI